MSGIDSRKNWLIRRIALSESYTMDRYQVIDLEDARERQLPGTDSYSKDSMAWLLYDMTDPINPRFVGDDNCEPEDRLLVRDFSWVAVELNRLANECRTHTCNS